MNFNGEIQYMELNLNLNEYSLSDLLTLFKISELNEKTLKDAYKLTLYTHPDKSGLDKMYFIFSKAYKLLNTVFRIYENKDTFEQPKSDISVEQVHYILNQENFSEVFNNMFNKLQNIDAEQEFGYEEWLKTHKVKTTEKVDNIKHLHSNIDERKRQLAIVHNQDNIMTINECGYSITREILKNYDSTIFSKLPYQDLKKACTETLIPVSSCLVSSQNKNVHDYQRNRELSKQHYVDNSKAYLKHKLLSDKQEKLEQLYKLTHQFENEKKNQELWSSYMKQIKNDI